MVLKFGQGFADGVRPPHPLPMKEAYETFLDDLCVTALAPPTEQRAPGTLSPDAG